MSLVLHCEKAARPPLLSGGRACAAVLADAIRPRLWAEGRGASALCPPGTRADVRGDIWFAVSLGNVPHASSREPPRWAPWSCPLPSSCFYVEETQAGVSLTTTPPGDGALGTGLSPAGDAGWWRTSVRSPQQVHSPQAGVVTLTDSRRVLSHEAQRHTRSWGRSA